MNPWFGPYTSRWPVVPLREFAALGTGHTPSRKVDAYWRNCTIPWVTVEDIRTNGVDSFVPLLETRQKISELGMKNSAAVLHPVGTVMLSRTASIGFSCTIGREMATTQAFVTWTPKPEALDSGYLLAVLRTMREFYFAIAYGATHLTIYFPDIKKLRIPLPSIEEQTKIAKFLDYETAKIDALIEKQQQLIALLKEKRQAVISHAVTKGLNPDAPMRDSGVEWLGEVPAHWRILNLNRVVRTFVDYRGRTPEKTDDGRPLVTAGAVRNGIIDLDRAPQFVSEETYHFLRRRGLPDVGDLLFTSEAPLGEVAIVGDTEIACAQRIIMFKLERERVTPEFLWLYLRSQAGGDAIQTKASGSTAEGIRADRLRRCRVLVPPIDEQVAIFAHVAAETDGFDAILELASQQTALLQERRTALISAAVTGKIDVRNWTPPEPGRAAEVL